VIRLSSGWYSWQETGKANYTAEPRSFELPLGLAGVQQFYLAE